MTADEIRGVLRVLYIQGDAAVWDECWCDEDARIVERWGPTLMQTGRRVAVHCSMGMERSVLAVAYYLHATRDMGLDEAYALIMESRPIALDRRSWACPLDHWHSNESQEDCTLGGSDV